MATTATKESLVGSGSCAEAGARKPAQGRSLVLPSDRYALLLRLHTSPSTIVVGDSGNLANSGRLPYEIFPGVDLVSNEETMSATADAIEQMGLTAVFDPDPTQSIKSIPLSEAVATIGSLLIMAPPGRIAEVAKEIHRHHAAEMNDFVMRARSVAVRYEWEILKHTFRCPSPCVVTDEMRRIVSANNILCDMLGTSADEVIGTSIDDLVHFEREIPSAIPSSPECVEVTTPIFIKPLFLFFISNVSLTRIPTVCGTRTIYVLQDIYTDRRAGNSNILLIQKMSNMVLSDGPPQTVIRRLINLLTLTLSCDLVTVLRRKENNEMLVTPYSNRRPETFPANVLEAAKEPMLEAFFATGSPVFCENVEKMCPEGSFFRRVSQLERFALLPIGDGTSFEHAVLVAWSKRDTGLGPEAMPLLRIIGNLIGCVLTQLRLATENEQEKETLRRYTRLTAGRETRMADLKRENAQMRDLLTELGAPRKE